MTKNLIVLIILLSNVVFGQDKFNHVNFDKLTEVKGSDYVIASIQNRGKIETKGKYLMFINTKDGKTKQIDFSKDSYIQTIEQILIPELEINKIILIAKTVNLNGDKTIDWNDPSQVFILSTDGENKTQLTEDDFFMQTWTTNANSGTITIAGYLDSNANGKRDKTDKHKILIYDLRTLELKSEI